MSPRFGLLGDSGGQTACTQQTGTGSLSEQNAEANLNLSHSFRVAAATGLVMLHVVLLNGKEASYRGIS